MIQGQMSLFDFSERVSELKSKNHITINFSCFSTFRSEAGGVRYGECSRDHCCRCCEAYIRFYEKAEEYQKAGNLWGRSIALAKIFFGIPTVPEYEVEVY